MFCKNCGGEIPQGTAFCPNCGVAVDVQTQQTADNAQYGQQEQAYNSTAYSQQNYAPNYQSEANYVGAASPKSRLIALLLCVFLGGIGAHRFYVGKIGTGILYLFTGGLFGIGYLIDLIMICIGTFNDASELPLVNWEERM